MRVLLVVLAWSWSVAAFAQTQVIFNRDETAMVVLTGMLGDMDAPNFYHALKMDPVEENGKWTKKLALVSPTGERVWDIGCIFSKTVENNGKCVLVFRRSSLVEIQSGAGRFRLHLTDAAEAAKWADLFHGADLGAVYRSQDGRLEAVVESGAGGVSGFLVNWKSR